MRNKSVTFGMAAICCFSAFGSVAAWAANPQVIAGANRTVMLRANGTLWACGDNSLGELGDGTTTNRTVATRVGTDTDWSQMASGAHHTVALKADGTLWAWGDNSLGQLGLGTTVTTQTAPAQVGTDADWKAVVVGDYHTVALKTDGTLWAWGESYAGQVGQVSAGACPQLGGFPCDTPAAQEAFADTVYPGMMAQPVPMQVGTDTNWASVAAGAEHTVMVKTNGTLWGMGANYDTQLGDGTNQEIRAPHQIGTDTDWASVTAGHNQTATRKTAGTLFTFGLNSDGELGDGTFANKDVPTKVNIDTNWKNISMGMAHTVALKKDGTLVTWGDNAEGQCGEGAAGGKRNQPLQIGTDKDFVAVDAGESHSVALKANGTVRAFGDNTFGQLCNGTTIAKAAPSPSVTPVSGDLDVDGELTVADVLKSLRLTVGLRTATAEDLISAPLASSNGVFSIIDAMLILRKAAGLPVNF